MLEWKKISCAVDFGDPSRLAMRRAAELAKRLEADLTLVHVLFSPPAAASDVLVSSRGVAAIEADRAGETLARWRTDAERRAGRAVRSRMLSGDPAAEILRHVGEDCDLLVVGTHGRGGVARLVLGSVAERLVRRSPCSVLVVHDHGALERDEVEEELGQYR